MPRSRSERLQVLQGVQLDSLMLGTEPVQQVNPQKLPPRISTTWIVHATWDSMSFARSIDQEGVFKGWGLIYPSTSHLSCQYRASGKKRTSITSKSNSQDPPYFAEGMGSTCKKCSINQTLPNSLVRGFGTFNTKFRLIA